jgi:hypothetical protein
MLDDVLQGIRSLESQKDLDQVITEANQRKYELVMNKVVYSDALVAALKALSKGQVKQLALQHEGVTAASLASFENGLTGDSSCLEGIEEESLHHQEIVGGSYSAGEDARAWDKIVAAQDVCGFDVVAFKGTEDDILKVVAEWAPTYASADGEEEEFE